MTKQFGWTLTILGLVLLIIGLISVTAPNMTVPTLILYFGMMLLIIGGVQGALCLMLRKKMTYWPYILTVAIIFALAGLYMIKNADAAAARFTIIVACWAILVGGIQLYLSVKNKSIRVFLFSMGVISIFFGALMFFNPFSGPNTIQFMVGFYTLLLSFFVLYVSIRMIRKKNVSDISETI
jgi:uncharacterized membrane protein HdeD (DUF308 family)